MKNKQVKIAICCEKNFIPILNSTTTVNTEKINESERTANGEIPNACSQKCNNKKWSGGLFSFLKIPNKSPKLFCAWKMEKGSSKSTE